MHELITWEDTPISDLPRDDLETAFCELARDLDRHREMLYDFRKRMFTDRETAP